MRSVLKFQPTFPSNIVLACLITFMIACAPEKNSEGSPIVKQEAPRSPDPIMMEPELAMDVRPVEATDLAAMPSADIISADRPASQENKKDFKVVLSVDSIMYLHQSGMMQVWVGEEGLAVPSSKNMAQDVKKKSSTIGKYAKITPIAPDFEIKAYITTVCHKIDPGGSELSYALTPKDEGKYKVSAVIELFDTPDCTGISVPKTARALSVSVGVYSKKEISKAVHEMEGAVWGKFKIFWLALITLLFGAAIFVIRRYIKNKTGYEGGPNVA